MTARRPRARRDRDISALRLCAGHWRSWHGPAAPAHGLGVPEAGSLYGLGLAWAQELRDPASSHVRFRGRRGRCPLRRPFGYSRRRPARPRAPSAHAQPCADGPALAACAGPDVPQANTYVPRPSQPMSAFAPGGVAAGGGGGRGGGGGGGRLALCARRGALRGARSLILRAPLQLLLVRLPQLLDAPLVLLLRARRHCPTVRLLGACSHQAWLEVLG